MKIEIITDRDSSDCETCGSTYADGGRVLVDGVEVLSRPARAHCLGGSDYSDSDLLVMALAKLGHQIVVDGSPYHVACHDDEYHGPMPD